MAAMMPPRNGGMLILGADSFHRDLVRDQWEPRCLYSLVCRGSHPFGIGGGGPVDFSDRRLWFGAVGVIVIVYEVWFSGIPTPQ